MTCGLAARKERQSRRAGSVDPRRRTVAGASGRAGELKKFSRCGAEAGQDVDLSAQPAARPGQKVKEDCPKGGFPRWGILLPVVEAQETPHVVGPSADPN